MSGERGGERGVSLAPEEVAALGALGEEALEAGVRLHRRPAGGAAARVRALVLALSGGRAVALGNHVFLPGHCADDLPVLAHELTHCIQYRRWGPVRYYWRGAVERLRELVHRCGGRAGSPYTYCPEPGKPFEAYGMEQQGQIVEDCFRGSEPARRISPYAPGRRRGGPGIKEVYPPTGRTRSRPGRRSSP